MRAGLSSAYSSPSWSASSPAAAATTAPRARGHKTSAKAPEKELVKGTCWDNDQLPDVLDEDAFDDWVEKYAGGDADLGDSMRDDAAFSKKIDCTEPHSLELYNVVDARAEADRADQGVRRPAGPEVGAVPQDRGPGERPVPGRVGVREGAAQGRWAPGAARPRDQRRQRLQRCVGPVPRGPVGEGSEEVRVHLRAGPAGDAVVRGLHHAQGAGEGARVREHAQEVRRRAAASTTPS